MMAELIDGQRCLQALIGIEKNFSRFGVIDLVIVELER